VALRRNCGATCSYRIANDAAAEGKRTDPLIGELFKLPVDEYKPSTHVGVVNYVEFDGSRQEWFVGVDNKHAAVWGPYYDCECIVYWAPFPTAPNTYTPRGEDQDLWYYTGVVQHERRIFDYLESRKLRNKKEEE
jgi:hypothetical protein